MKSFEYYKPRSLEEVWELKEKIPEALFIAGGTDVMVGIHKGEINPPALISLRSIPELNSIEPGETTRIGAMATVSDLIHHSSMPCKFPILVEAAKKMGSPQIRNVATIGGNLCNCSPCADLALPLLVLEARVRLQSIQGSRVIPLDDFFVGPGNSCITPYEILTDIFLESVLPNTKTAFLKKGRVKMDLAVVNIAVLLEMEEERCRKARVAAGSVAHVPLRLSKVETLLENASISEKIIQEAQALALDCVSPITDVRGTEEYRREIVSVYIKRALKKALEWSEA